MSEERSDIPDGRAPKRCWSRRKAFGLLCGAVSLAGLVGNVAVGISDPGIGRFGALLTMTAGVLVGGREIVHVRERYHRWEGTETYSWAPEQRRYLALLVVVTGILTACSVIGGVSFFFHPNNWLEIVLSGTVLVGLLAATSEMDDLVGSEGGPRTGTAAVANYPVTKKIRNIAVKFGELPGVEAVDELLWQAAGKGRISRLVLVAILCLVAACAAQATVVVPEAVKYINRNGKSGQKEPGKHGHGGAESSSSGRRPHGVPTYEELCGGPVKAGIGAPHDEAVGLQLAWEARGGVVAACSKEARPVPGADGAYFALGYCGGEFRSLAIASPEHPSAVLIEEMAQVARRMVIERRLVGASPRRKLGPGDFQILFSQAGPYLAIREERTDGEGGPKRKPLRCDELRQSRSKYVLLPPGMAEIWLELAELKVSTWPAPSAADDEPGRSFVFDDSAGNRKAAGSCLSPTDCELKSGSLELESTGANASAVTPGRIIEYGPD